MLIDKPLSTQEWKSIIDKCRDAGISQLTFTGGEPTEREDLVELIDYAQWHVTRLNTNGINLTLAYAKKLFDANLDGVQVTLYSQDAAVHDTLVGRKGAWSKTVQSIRNALKAGLSVSVNTPLVRMNSKYEETLKFIQGLGVKYVSCSGLIPGRRGQESDQIRGSPFECRFDESDAPGCEDRKNPGLGSRFTSPGWLTHEQIEQLGLSDPVCGACLSNMAVMPNGAVTACQSWLSDPNGLGNLLTSPWHSIWDHPRCKEMRRIPQEGCPLNQTVGQEVRQ